MKILFLGTSAGWPLPRLGCSCQICKSKDPRDIRLRPAVLINDSILIDAPPDIYHQLLKISNSSYLISNIKALILTHAHPDHVLGFYDLTHLYNRVEKEPKLITTQEVLNGLRQIHRFSIAPFKPEIIVPKETMVIDNIKIAFYPVHHNHTPCYAIKMKGEKIFLYIPDIKRLPRSERKPFKGVNLLVLDGSSLGKRGQTRIHQSIEEGIRLAQELHPKQCFFTHIGHITGTYKDLEKFVQKNGGRNFHIAYDGLELQL